MNVYEYFQNIRRMDMKIQNANNEIKRLTDMMSGIGAVDYARESIQNGKTEKEPSFVYKIEQIDEHRRALEQMVERYENYRQKAFERLDILTPIESRVLYLRYFEYKNLEAVAAELNYSFFGVRHIYRSAIKRIREHYGEYYGEEV